MALVLEFPDQCRIELKLQAKETGLVAELTLISPDGDIRSHDLSRDNCRTLADALHAIARKLR